MMIKAGKASNKTCPKCDGKLELSKGEKIYTKDGEERCYNLREAADKVCGIKCFHPFCDDCPLHSARLQYDTAIVEG